MTVKETTSSDLYNEEQTKAYMHQNGRVLRMWRRYRGLPHLKITKKTILYRKGDLDRWLDEHRTAIVG